MSIEKQKELDRLQGKLNRRINDKQFDQAYQILHKLILSVDKKNNPEEISISTYKHISDTVWVVSTDKKLKVDEKYKLTNSDVSFDYFKVHYRFKSDSVYRYIITELLGCNI